MSYTYSTWLVCFFFLYISFKYEIQKCFSVICSHISYTYSTWLVCFFSVYIFKVWNSKMFFNNMHVGNVYICNLLRATNLSSFYATLNNFGKIHTHRCIIHRCDQPSVTFISILWFLLLDIDISLQKKLLK